MLAFPPDFTFVVQLASFFVLLAVLNRLLFKPFGELLAERSRRTEGATASAEHDRNEADQLKATFDDALTQARVEASIEAETVRREARAAEVEIFEAAKTAAATHLAGLRDGIGKERAAAQGQLRASADELARQMVAAILGDTASS